MPRKKGKHRQQISKAIPFAKGVMRDKADRLWALAVFGDWGWKCAFCGRHNKTEVQLHPHHLIPRQYERHRYDLKNGIALCSWHHVRDPEVSPHVNPACWMLWLSEDHEERHQWLTETLTINRYKNFNGTTNATYFIGVIRNLKQYMTDEGYERILGVKFSRWLADNA